jgi:hypothetical protein
MTSIQATLLTAYMRLRRFVSPQTRHLNLEKERADMDALANMFKPLADLNHQPVDAGGISAEWITPSRMEGWAHDPVSARGILRIWLDTLAPQPGRKHRRRSAGPRINHCLPPRS